MKRSVIILLALLFFGALFLRLFKLDSFPVGFHIDEASLGYNGYSLLKTGKDENNNRFPLYVDMFGDNRPSGYHYLTVLPVALFGLTEFATRLPGALIGSLTVFALYYLVFVIFKEKKYAFLATFLLVISPWHIVLSRASAETIVALFFILLGFGLILDTEQKRQKLRLILGTASLSLSFFFYHTPRLFVPILFMALLVLFIQRNKRNIAAFIVLSIISGLLIFVVKGGTGRFDQVSIFGSPTTKLVAEEQIREDGTEKISSFVSRAYHNKLVAYGYTFVVNYFDYFTGKFFYTEGGRPLWYRVPYMGLFYLVSLPFLLIGAAHLLLQKNRLWKLPLVWIVLAPITASITMDDQPNLQRTMVMFPMIELVAAYGFLVVSSWVSNNQKKLLYVEMTIAMTISFAYFWHQYFVHGKTHQTWYRFNGFDRMVEKTVELYDEYDWIIMTKTLGGIYPHVLFYAKYDPATYQSEGSPKDRDAKGFGKFIFAPQFCPSIDGDERFPKSGRILYVDNATCNVPVMLKQETILREDGTPAFKIVY